MMQQEPRYDVREAARRSGMSFRTLYRWIASGILPATFTRPTLVRLSDIGKAQEVARKLAHLHQQKARCADDPR